MSKDLDWVLAIPEIPEVGSQHQQEQNLHQKEERESVHQTPIRQA